MARRGATHGSRQQSPWGWSTGGKGGARRVGSGRSGHGSRERRPAGSVPAVVVELFGSAVPAAYCSGARGPRRSTRWRRPRPMMLAAAVAGTRRRRAWQAQDGPAELFLFLNFFWWTEAGSKTASVNVRLTVTVSLRRLHCIWCYRICSSDHSMLALHDCPVLAKINILALELYQLL